MGELLPAFKSEDAEGDGGDSQANGHRRVPSDAAKYSSQVVASPLFPEVEKLLSLFKDSCKELLELRKQVFLPLSISSLFYFEVLILLLLCFGWKIDGRLYNLKKEVSVQDSKHRKTLSEVSLEYTWFVLCENLQLSLQSIRINGCEVVVA